mmetsp:Transcript_21062/g.32145  ORF Transcript_21062/g.32145 Transcript_21062/m.32145 type:complete len:129 (-) Transcript_21062:618-1004(-)
MHPLVRDLYKRAIVVGRDYPHPDGLNYVRNMWKKALRAYKYPSEKCEVTDVKQVGRRRGKFDAEDEKDLLKAVARGRYMIREMIGVIQLKKYRTMKQRYSDENNEEFKGTISIQAICALLENNEDIAN